jgi:uncharacterized membrane protein YhaH (DUF805 family)
LLNLALDSSEINLRLMQPESPYAPPATFEPLPTRLPQSNAALTIGQILFSFNGRIPRRLYWLWVILSTVAFLVPFSLLMPFLDDENIIAVIITIPLVLAFFWVSLAIRVKRWHDHGKSGAWVLIGMIPYIGSIISLIVLGCTRGTQGHNLYGSDPT